MITVLCEGRVTPVAGARREQEDLLLPLAALDQVTGWALEPEGLCRGEVCIPLPADSSPLVQGDALNVSGLWRHLGRPVVHDASAATWLLGGPAESDRQALSMLEAPDVVLPDLDGRLHALRDYRGTKVFLVAWASW